MAGYLTLQQLAQALGGEVTGGKVLCPGPGHSPKDRSLSVALGDTELGIVVHSFAGDPWQACIDHVRSKTGLPAFEPRKKNSRGVHLATTTPSDDLAARRAAATARATAVLKKKDSEPTAVYDYFGADGAFLYQVLRFEPKTFRQRRPDGRGGWISDLDGTPRVPFRLPEMLTDQSPVYYTEGEKDCLRIAKLSLCSTTISGGTAWTPALAEYFRGRDTIILPDFDDKGVKRALDAANALHGTAASIRIVFLPGLTGEKDSNDVSDWLDKDPARGKTLADICAKAPLWSPGVDVEGMADAAAVATSAKDRQPTAQGDDGELGEWDAGEDHGPIPPRGWLLGNAFCRRFVSSLLAEGGTAKSTIRLAQLLSSASGRALTGEHVFQRCRVLIVSLEDDRDELRRRLRAAQLHHKIADSDLAGWLFLAAPGTGGGKIMALDQHGKLTVGKLAHKLARTIERRKIDIACIDPLVKAHAVEENSNVQIDGLMQVLADMAAKYDIAVDIPHHVAKGAADPGNANRGRGASAMKDGARLVYTLSVMTPEEAQVMGVHEQERRKLIRMDSAKVNITPPMTEAKWFKLIGVSIGNSSDVYPNGDEIPTVVRWSPPDAFAGMNSALLNAILTEIDAGLPGGNRYADTINIAHDREAWRVIVKHCPVATEAQARQIIRLWVKSGLLIRREYENPTTRKTVKGFWVDHEKRPS